MNRRKLQTVLSAAWVGLGALQTSLGAVDGEVVYAALGAIFAATGAGYYWAEVRHGDGSD